MMTLKINYKIETVLRKLLRFQNKYIIVINNFFFFQRIKASNNMSSERIL